MKLNSFVKKTVLVCLSLMLALAVLVNCGGGGGGGSDPGPGAATLFKRTMISDFRTNPDYIYAHGVNSPADYKRIMISDFRTSPDYIYAHGVNSPDKSKLYVAVNETTAGGGGVGDNMTGNFTGYLLDMSDVLAGTVSTSSVIATSPATPAAVAFRSTFTPDGSKILQAGADRLVVLDGSTLATLSTDTNIGGENHDVMPTPDGKYALLALRYKNGAEAFNTSGLQLYNIQTGQYGAVGNPVNTCGDCHNSATVGHVTCGIDGPLTGTGPYTGTIYMASTSGGHIVRVPVTIDPTNTGNEIAVGAITKINLTSTFGATNKTHNFHDVRYDAATNRVYYSAIVADSAGGAVNGQTHLGYVDIGASNAVHDATIETTAAAQAQIVYCASAQTADYYIPMTMSYPAYIDVIRKNTVKTGAALTSTPKQLYVAVNETTAGGGGVGDNMTGNFTGYLLKMSDILAGTVNTSSVMTTSPTTSAAVAFRSTFTPDGSKILQAGADRLVVLDATDLSELSNDTAIGGENHDVMPTPDGKYALLALRYKNGTETQNTSGLQLYNIQTGQYGAVGNPVNTCGGCHNDTVAHVTCGIDGPIKDNHDGTYSGTIYMASTGGGHIVRVAVTINPAGTTADNKIVVTAKDKVQLSSEIGALNKTHNFHDVRYDAKAKRVYYSAIVADGSGGALNGRTHLGYVDVSTATFNATVVHDATIATTAAAQAQIVYCASGQTADYFVPMTMSYPAYIDAIKKSDIVTDAKL